MQFQSSAGFDPGRYRLPQQKAASCSWFQSSAGFDPGRYPVITPDSTPALLFQSSAGFDPGRYYGSIEIIRRARCFNPRPGLTPAATSNDKLSVSLLVRFQSSAGFDPGRYPMDMAGEMMEQMFQSSAGFDPGRY